MAAASELLKRVMNAYPQIKKFAAQKLSMEAALREKGFTEDKGYIMSDMNEYANLIAQLNFSIDYVIQENGFTHDFGDGVTLSTILSGVLDHHKCLADMTEYKSYDFKEDKKIMYLTKKPVASCVQFCFNAPNLLFLPRFDFSKVTAYHESLTSANPARYIYDEYEMDCSSLKELYSTVPRFAKTLIFKNMGNNVNFWHPFNGTSVIKSMKGLNISGMKQNLWSPWGGSNVIPHIEFAEGSYIRYGTILIDHYISDKTNTDKFTIYDKFDDETLRDFCEHAYDWKTNPENLTDVEYGTGNNGAKMYNFKSYRFTDGVKTRLATTYPNIDFQKMMEDKGWTW